LLRLTYISSPLNLLASFSSSSRNALSPSMPSRLDPYSVPPRRIDHLFSSPFHAFSPLGELPARRERVGVDVTVFGGETSLPMPRIVLSIVVDVGRIVPVGRLSAQAEQTECGNTVGAIDEADDLVGFDVGAGKDEVFNATLTEGEEEGGRQVMEGGVADFEEDESRE
jgi:hypothetical protein